MLANPRLAQLGAAVTMPTADPELRALYREIRTAGETAFREMLAAAVERGELRDDVDLDVVTRILSTVLTDGIRAIAIHRLGVDFMDLCSGEAAALPDDDLALIVDDTLTVLLHGIASR
jgi:hypothetical protein